VIGIVSRANILQGLATLKPEVTAAEAITDAAATTDKVMRDTILETVKHARWRPWLWNVTVRNGVADLWGITETSEAKRAIGVEAENTPGVNHIIVRPHNWSQAKPYLTQP
jgi:osmotically-inducible protein OsmY